VIGVHVNTGEGKSGQASNGAAAQSAGAAAQGVAERASLERTSAAVRGFNRFYTNVIGLLRAGYLHTPYTLTEARVIFELAQGGRDAAGLRRELDLDAGYLSRILARFEADGLITRERSRADGRRQLISLTTSGHAAFRMLDERADAHVRTLINGFSEEDRLRLTAAMATIQRIVWGPSAGPARGAPYVLRAPRPGELGWVIQRNGAIYAEEFGWDETYEALVARIVADYASSHDPRLEAAWIAEVDGEPAGCVFCMRNSEKVAQLRLLLVEPKARGLGLGSRLVAECIGFAKRAGYTEMMLWTNDVLVAARRIYEAAGFELTESERHHSFGHDLVGQIWRLPLTSAPDWLA
jgi:DNA-binding MarR family transcriptional regulator/GNAT superfamily N-acetyltransferase